MAVDKLVDSAQLDADLTSVANAIRTKGGTSADLAFPAEFVSAIAAIPTGGGGANLATGSFTLSADTLASALPAINVGFDYSTIIVYTNASWLGNGKRSAGGIFYRIASGKTYGQNVSTNTSGSSANIGAPTTSNSEAARINYVGQKVGQTFVFAGDSQWPGYYISGLQYFWAAW